MNRFAYSGLLALTLAPIIAALVFLFPVAARSQNPEWMNFTGPDVHALADDGHYLWIGGGGLVRLDRSTGEMVFYNRVNSGLPDNDVNAIAIDAQGNKWIGTSNGLAKFNGASWAVYNTDNSGLPDNRVRALAIGAQGDIWIGTLGGLAKFDGFDWTVYNTDNSKLPSNSIHDLAIDSRGGIWIGTSNGLAKFDGVDWEVYRTYNSGLPDDIIWALVTDAQGNTWIGTGGGLAVYRKGGVILPKLGVEGDRSAEVPSAFSLSQNYPNPFNAATEISFTVPKRSRVRIAIYNLLGQLVRELADREYSSGVHRVRWDGTDSLNTPVSSGVYIYRMTTDMEAITKKMVLLR